MNLTDMTLLERDLYDSIMKHGMSSVLCSLKGKDISLLEISEKLHEYAEKVILTRRKLLEDLDARSE